MSSHDFNCAKINRIYYDHDVCHVQVSESPIKAPNLFLSEGTFDISKAENILESGRTWYSKKELKETWEEKIKT